MEYPSIFSKDFDEMVVNAGRLEREETLRMGIPVSYLDADTGLSMMEYPDGRIFEIRFIPGAARDKNFEIVREIGAQAS